MTKQQDIVEELIEDVVDAATSGLVPRPAHGTFSPFRYPVFRAIWIANLFSNLGSTLQSVGAAWLMTELTTSHKLVALVQASATVPIMFLGVFAGAIADNYDRRMVMLISQVGMLVVSALLAVLTYAGWMTPYLLLSFTFGVGTGTALNSPAWQASVRQQVDPEQLPQAIALNSISFNIARSVGPALGGLLISIWNPAFAFAINAVSYIGLIVVLLWWRPEARTINARPILPAVGAGIAFCARSVPLRRILIRGFGLGFCLATFQSLLPGVVNTSIHGSEVDYGIMLGLFGIGSILAAPSIGPIRRRLGLEGILALGASLYIVALLIAAAGHTLVAVMPSAFLAGVSWVLILTTINTAVQMRSPDEVLGRCLSIYQAVTFGGMAMGAGTWGTLADWKGLPFALHGGAVLLFVSFVVLRFIAPMPRPGEGVLRPR
ncbi:putative MFS family arabinose efflux permease [Novosphingobium sp. PhB165]|uniref:MFS transporter n=1 Tax=Novosphingobium sp. PhB165 TaxID=2485105 RepID=UPI0010452DB9|nr:MFS transporter [Novosphingobium sp. PhB165]TCM18500.1 putative MFS family arabinose efflux permease [Novosphingobium sp. PhB165]